MSEKESPIYNVTQNIKDQKQLAEDDSFTFSCHSGLSCFTRCCGDVNILLTPLDVLRLARCVKLSTSDFLQQHTIMPITKELHLPVVVLKMAEDEGKRCPFLGKEGCNVYEERPWSCRMYPLGMALPPARAGVEPKPMYFLFEDDYCAGRGEPREWTVKSWRSDQKVEEQEELEAGFRELVSHPWFIGGRQLGPKKMEMFYTSCYDLDAFRCFVFESTFLKRFELDDSMVESMRSSDEALLQFAFRWLRFALFAEPTMTVRPEDA